MDLHTVTRYRAARTRADLALSPGEAYLAGGTWLYSEPQPGVTGLVDLTGMGWPAWEELDSGDLRIGATCSIAELAALSTEAGARRWTAAPLFAQCASALLASFKVLGMATVGGNICRSFAAASMVSLAVTLDGVAVVWGPDGRDHRVRVGELITGNGTNALRPDEVLRAVELPRSALAARTGFRKIALSRLGRSGAVLTGRAESDGSCVFVITAATLRPVALRYRSLPGTSVLLRDVENVEGYYTDPLGSADWRRQVSGVLLEEIRREFAG